MPIERNTFDDVSNVVTSLADARLYDKLGTKNGVYKGLENECETVSSGLVATVKTGVINIASRQIVITADEVIIVDAVVGEGYIIAKVDLSQIGDLQVAITFKQSVTFPTLQQDDLNLDGTGIYEFALYSYINDGLNIVLTDVRTYWNGIEDLTKDVNVEITSSLSNLPSTNQKEVNEFIDDNYNMKTFTSLGQVGASDANTLSELFNLMPNGSIIEVSISTASTMGLDLPQGIGSSAVLKIERYTSSRGYLRCYFRDTIGTSYVFDNIVRGAGTPVSFRGWEKIGYGYINTFTTLEQIGLTDGDLTNGDELASFGTIVNAMVDGSVLEMNLVGTNLISICPDISGVLTVKRASASVLDFKFKSFNTTDYYVATGYAGVWSGWKKFALVEDYNIKTFKDLSEIGIVDADFSAVDADANMALISNSMPNNSVVRFYSGSYTNLKAPFGSFSDGVWTVGKAGDVVFPVDFTLIPNNSNVKYRGTYDSTGGGWLGWRISSGVVDISVTVGSGLTVNIPQIKYANWAEISGANLTTIFYPRFGGSQKRAYDDTQIACSVSIDFDTGDVTNPGEAPAGVIVNSIG